MPVLSISSLNTRGLNDPVKCLTAFTFLNSEKHDIFLLQECNIPYRDDYKTFEQRWTFGQSVWSGDNKNRASGVVVLFKGKDFCIKRVKRVIGGRLLCIDVEWHQLKFRIINVYCPPDLNERLEVLKEIQPLLVCGSDVILGGDFNCLMDKKDRMTVATVRLDSSSEMLNNLIKDFKLNDTFRYKNPNTPGYTWSNGTICSRIDFLLTTKNILVSDAAVTPVFFSDHSKIDCTIRCNVKAHTSQNPWKLNVSLLKDLKLVERLKDKLKRWISLQFLFQSVGEWWEDLKSRTKNFFTREGKRIAMKKRFKYKKQQAKLQRLYTMAHSGFDVAVEIVRLKKEMIAVTAEDSKGLLMRSRTKHMEDNEKCSRYFFRKLARPRNTMSSILNEDGIEKTETKDILALIHTFYTELYKEGVTDINALEDLLSFLKPNVGIASELESDLTVNELTKAIQSMQDNKAPGADGLPKEFYVTFWDVLKDPLLEMFNESLHSNNLPLSLRTGIISLLYKKGDKKDIKNWRPLTLLGVDRKILAKALFFRLQQVSGQIVGEEQTCAIPGRYMSESLALVRDSYLYACDRRLPLCISALDLEKAFDKVSHTFLRKVLVKLGFGPQLRAWIDLLYTDCLSKVVINGHSTDTFEVCSGVRQGCPLSVMLFIFAMEPLARAIKEDPSIHGLQVPGSGGQEAKLSVYMDDLTILCTDNKSILKVLYWCDQFSAASSAKLNRSKSEILYLNWPEPKFNHGLVQRDERIKILGLEIGQNMENINWEKKLPKIKGKLLQWEQRNLTFTGKVLVINSEIVASLTYLAATIPAPKYVMTALRRCIFQFVWGAQQERIRREIMYRPLQKGGKNVPDLAKKMEALFLTPILQAVLNENRRSLWPNFAMFWVGHQVLRKVGLRPCLKRPHAEKRPLLYERVVTFVKSGKWRDVGRVDRAFVESCLSPERSRLVTVGALAEASCLRVWRNVNSPFLLNADRDLAWQAVQRCLPTRDFLKRRGSSKSARCPRVGCGGDEDVSHLLWSCGVARRVWSLLGPWLGDLFRVPTESDVLYGVIKSGDCKGWERWWALINCTKESMWRCRNRMVYKSLLFSAESIVNLSITLVKDYVWRDKERYGIVVCKELWKIENTELCRILC